MFKNTSCFLVVIILCSFCIPLLAMASAADTVNPEQVYSYETMANDIKKLAETYPGIVSYKSIGKTAYGRDIWAVKLGKGPATVFLNGSHHAREWMTTALNMYMIDQYAQAYKQNLVYEGYPVKDLLDKVTIWFVPMVNPDGVTLQQYGVAAFPEEVRNQLIQMNGGSSNFERWKANANGLDPNRQYDADWENIKNAAYWPGWMNHKGTAPVEGEEAKALVAFTYEINPEIAVAYHSAGQILYWFFHNTPENMDRDKAMADDISNMTGYSEVIPVANPSGGGYTDWFIQEFGRPGFTPEIATKTGETSVPLSQWNTVWYQNKSLGLYIANKGYKLWLEKAPIEKIDSKLQIFGAKELYNHPDGGFTGAMISSQTVQSFEKKGDWFHIRTWLGDNWISGKEVAVGNVENLDSKVELIDTASFYQYPLDGSSAIAQLSPQSLYAVQKLNNWYKVKTWMGEYWIDKKYIVQTEPINQNLQLTQDTPLRQHPTEKTDGIQQVNPK